MAPESLLLIEITGPSLDALRTFVDEVDADLGCRPVAKRSVDGFVLGAQVRESELASAQRSAPGDVRVRVLANQTQIGSLRQREVGVGNRFAARADTPRGFGRKV